MDLDEKRRLVINYMSVKWPDWPMERILACLLLDSDRCGYINFENYLDAVIEQQGLGK